MRFLFNQHQVAIDLDGVNPNMTILQWLRENSHKGTKEGCASGDCGACTAVIGELVSVAGETVIEYKSINTCIALVLNLAGKHLVTVEGLTEGNTLHPVQQAMVQTNGSQCGFCTPGFVMSLFALYHNESNLDLDKINDTLSGNLCRCTGYKPIIDAAFLCFENKPKNVDDYYSKNRSRIIKSLLGLTKNVDEQYRYTQNSNTVLYDAPNSIDKLSSLLHENPSAKLIAGGSDLGLDITQQLQQFDHIINVQGVREMNIINNSDDCLEIGASVSYHSAWSVLVESFPSLEPLLVRFGSKPIRNWATIGGNIANASPIGDMPPVLIALDSVLKLRRGSAVRQVKIQDFFTGYRKTALMGAEFIESITIPKLQSNESLLVHKISKRYEDDISTVCMAMKFRTDGGVLKEPRVAFGGMAEIPKRATQLERVIEKNWDTRELARPAYDALKKDFSPIDDVRASGEYRLQVSANLIQKIVLNYFFEELPNMAETR